MLAVADIVELLPRASDVVWDEVELANIEALANPTESAETNLNEAFIESSISAAEQFSFAYLAKKLVQEYHLQRFRLSYNNLYPRDPIRRKEVSHVAAFVMMVAAHEMDPL